MFGRCLTALSKLFFTGSQLAVERRDAAPQVCVRIRLRTQLLESRNSFQRFGFGVCRTASSGRRCGSRVLFFFAGVFLLFAQG